jgi:L-2-hydroxyglutarate oxidase LhgO
MHATGASGKHGPCAQTMSTAKCVHVVLARGKMEMEHIFALYLSPLARTEFHVFFGRKKKINKLSPVINRSVLGLKECLIFSAKPQYVLITAVCGNNTVSVVFLSIFL